MLTLRMCTGRQLELVSAEAANTSDIQGIQLGRIEELVATKIAILNQPHSASEALIGVAMFSYQFYPNHNQVTDCVKHACVLHSTASANSGGSANECPAAQATSTTTVLSTIMMLGLTQVVLSAKEAGPYYDSPAGRKAATTGLNSMRAAVSASMFTAAGLLLKSSKHFTDPIVATGSADAPAPALPGVIASGDAEAPALPTGSALRAAVLLQAKQLQDPGFISKLDHSSCAPFALQFFAEESTWLLTSVCMRCLRALGCV